MIFLGSPKFNSVVLSCRPKSFKSPFASWDFLLLNVYLTPSLPWVTRQNFSSPNQYNIKQTSDENKEKYPLGEYKLIHYQIHRDCIIKNLWQTVRRNTHVILGVKGSIQWCRFHQIFIVTLLLVNWKWPKFGQNFVRNYFAAKIHSKTLTFLVV